MTRVPESGVRVFKVSRMSRMSRVSGCPDCRGCPECPGVQGVLNNILNSRFKQNKGESAEENSEIKPNQGEIKSRKRRFLGLATSGALDDLRDLAIHLDEVQAENNEAKRNQIKSGKNIKFINYLIMALGRNKTGDLQGVV